MTQLRVLDLFSGIGGFSLGLEHTGGFETVAFCEIDEFCRKVLAKHWPNVPQHTDITELDGGQYRGAVDVVCGGFPCQPFSSAARGRNVAADLWPDALRVIQRAKPTWVLVENVAKAPIDAALRDLERVCGYQGSCHRISAHDAGADHGRVRWWACAHTDHQGQLRSAIDAEVAKLPGIYAGVWSAEAYARASRVSYGVSRRLDNDRLKALGNAVVPQVVEVLGRAILEAER